MGAGGVMGSLIQRKKKLMLAQKDNLLPPAGYVWIDYAESDGSAYVELPFGFDKTDIVEFRGAILDTRSDKFLVSPNAWNNSNNRYAMCGLNGGKFAIAFGSFTTSNTKFDVSKDDDFHTWIYKNVEFGISDLNKKLIVSGALWGMRTNNIRLFFGYNSNAIGKISYYKHTVSEDGIQHIIRPIQNISTGDVEMYDIATKAIMPRTGTLLAPQE